MMMSKKQVSMVLVLAVAAMVLMANFVSCGSSTGENMINGNARPGHIDDDHLGDNWKKRSELFGHHHDHGNRKKEGRDPHLHAFCVGDVCDTRFNECADSCWCVPVTLYGGLCTGFCC